MPTTVAEIMKMDGRGRSSDVIPLARRPHVTAPSVATVKRFINNFEKERGSGHSNVRSLLPYAIKYCEEQGYDYILNCKGGRYWLEVEGYQKPEPSEDTEPVHILAKIPLNLEP